MRKFLFRGKVLTVILLATILSSSNAVAGMIRYDFDDGNTDGWLLSSSGGWSIVDGSLLQNQGPDHTEGLIDNLYTSKQKIEVDVKIPIHTGGYGGLTLWYQDEFNNLEVIFYPYGGGIQVFERIDGVTTRTKYSPQPQIHTGSFRNLGINANAKKGILTIALDDSFLFDYSVTTLNRYGMSGIMSGNQGAYFDNFRLNYSGKPHIPNPEPATMILFGTGLVGLVGTGLRRRLRRMK